MEETGTYEISTWRYRAVCANRWPREIAERWVVDPRACFASGSAGPKPSQAIVVTESAPRGKIFVKRHARPLHKMLADALAGRPSPSLRGFRVGRRLELSAVSAVRPLAAVDRRWPGESYLILEHAEGVTLRDYLLTRLAAARREIERDLIKTALWTALAPCVARLHAAGVRQRDLKALNILIDLIDGPASGGGGPARGVDEAASGGGAVRATLLDLEGMQALKSLPDVHRRARDLGRLAASLHAPAVQEAGCRPADWEEFLRLYLEASRAAFPAERDLKWWVDATVAWAERKAERSRRRGRNLY